MEYARSRALQPVNRVGINLAGPDAAHPRDRGAEAAVARPHPRRERDLVPAVQRARSGLGPRRVAHPCGARSRAAGGSRARRSGRATRSSRGGGSGWSAPTPKRRSTAGSRSWSSTWRRRASRSGRWCRSPAKPSSTRSSSTACSCPRIIWSAVCTRVGRWRARRSRTSAAPRSRSRSRSCTRCSSTSSTRSPPRTGALDDVEISDALAQSFVELRVLRLHNWRTLSRLARGIEPGPESSLVKLAWTDMTQHLSDTALEVVGAGSPLRGEVVPAVAVVQGRVDRRRHLRGPAQHHRRADPRPPR